MTGQPQRDDSSEISGRDLSDVVPNTRRIHPAKLAVGGALFDNTGAMRHVTEAITFQDGRIVSALQDDDHRVWFRNDDPIIAVLRRTEPPSLTWAQVPTLSQAR